MLTYSTYTQNAGHMNSMINAVYKLRAHIHIEP